MNINVTQHAIKRYRERLFDYSSSKETVSSLLKEIACNGKQICSRPSSCGTCVEIKYKGVSIVAIKDNDTTVITTCLGDFSYRKWIKSKDTYPRVRGRVLYSNVI